MPVEIDYTPDSVDVILYAGDSGNFQVLIVDDTPAETPIDVSTWTFKAQVRRYRDSVDYINLVVDTTNAATGILGIQIPGATAAEITSSPWDKKWQWDLQANTPVTMDPVTIMQGSMFSKEDVTR